MKKVLSYPQKMHRKRLLPLYRLQVFERYAFYGLKSIVSIFLIKHLNVSKQETINITHTLFSIAFILPLFVSFCADVVFSKAKFLKFGLSFYLCTIAVVIFFHSSKTTFILSMLFIIVSNSIIRSTLPSFIVDQNKASEEGYDAKVAGSFVKHTFAVNIGMFLGLLTIPVILKEFGSKTVFFVTFVCILISNLFFYYSYRIYIKKPPQKANTIFKFLKEIPIVGSDKNPRSWLHIGAFLLMVSCFYFVLEQKYSIWIMQGETMDRNLFGYVLPSNIMLSFMPAMTLIILHLYERYFFKWLEKIGIKSLLDRVNFGILLATLCPLSVGIIQFFIDKGYKVHLLTQLIPYLLLVLADIAVYLSGIQYMYTQISQTHRTIAGSIWFLVGAMGNIWVVIFTNLLDTSKLTPSLFLKSAVVSFIASILFKFMVNKKRHKLQINQTSNKT